MVTGSETAISRKTPPVPLRWLKSKGLIKGRSLDYGSGHGCWYDMVCYDPKWRPTRPTGKFDTVSSLYVLNVVTVVEQRKIFRDVMNLLKPGGTAYFAVRRDLPKSGAKGRGTFQRYVVLSLPSIRRTSGYEIYALRKR